MKKVKFKLNFSKLFIFKFLVCFFVVCAIFFLLPIFSLYTLCREGVVIENQTLNSEVSKEQNREKKIWQKETDAIADYKRREEQTFLTFPEWYVVYSIQEYANFVKEKNPSGFPYFGSISQYWISYCKLYALTRSEYDFNFDYNLTLFIIGESLTTKNFVKGLYEKTVGKFTENISSDKLTSEDEFAKNVSIEYGDFLHTQPWYDFPFAEKRKKLWQENDFFGENFIRKLERKFSLSFEYSFESFYSYLVKGGTQSTYAPEKLEIYAVVNNFDIDLVEQNDQVKIIKELEENYKIISIERYAAFTEVVPKIVESGTTFLEIAGNDDILITIISPRDFVLDAGKFRNIFSIEVMTDKNLKRDLVVVKVEDLNLMFEYLKNNEIKLEHLYDY